MRSRKNISVIVDGYSTGNVLAGIFAAYGYSSIHVQSSEGDVPEMLTRTFKPGDFLRNIIYKGDIDSLCKEFAGFQVKCVIPGCESGVELADLLSEKLGLPTNGTEYSQARRNKYVMAEALKKANINSTVHLKSKNFDEIWQWVKENIGDLKQTPVVLKPLTSACTDGFHICRNEQEIKKAFDDLYLAKNIFSETNEEVLVQNYLDGQEYCVNMVSYDGFHYLSEIWRTNKMINGYSKIYDLENLVVPEDKEFNILKNYAESVLNALHIKFGPSHSEIIITKEGKPTLVETAARFMGSIDLSLLTEAQGTNVALLTAEAYLTPDKFLQRRHESRPKLKKIPYMVQLISKENGILQAYQLNKLKELKTFHGVDVYIKPGFPVKLTVDTCSSPGLVFLLGDNHEDLQKDYSAIREMERENSLYIVKSNMVKPSDFSSKNTLRYLSYGLTAFGLFSIGCRLLGSKICAPTQEFHLR